MVNETSRSRVPNLAWAFLSRQSQQNPNDQKPKKSDVVKSEGMRLITLVHVNWMHDQPIMSTVTSSSTEHILYWIILWRHLRASDPVMIHYDYVFLMSYVMMSLWLYIYIYIYIDKYYWWVSLSVHDT
jgi:hypothetical protein